MRFFALEYWPLWVITAWLLVAGIANFKTLVVRNIVSFPALLLGWLSAALVGWGVLPATHGGEILSSLAASLAALLAMFALYTLGGIGAGNVKMQMAFGAWVGAAMPTLSACSLTLAGTIAGLVLTSLCAWPMLKKARSRDQLGLTTEPQVFLFPAQVTLSLASIAAMLVAVELGWV